MGSLRSIVLTILIWIQLAASTSIKRQISGRDTIRPPTDDPFYSPPLGYESQKEGSILRTREIDSLAFEGSQPIDTASVRQLLFRSTDSLGNAAAAVTTVVIPHNANTTRLLSYQIAEDGVWIDCSPSFTLRFGAPQAVGGGDTSSIELLFILAALDQGWVVNVPDYQGLNSAYTSGLQGGRATLDSVRAALASGLLSPDVEYQLWGYSGGSEASEWAAELQPAYAPELNFVGAAIGGAIPSLPSALDAITGTSSAGLAVAGILGLAQAYPALKAFVDQHLIPATAAYFKRPLSQCLNDDGSDFTNQDISTYFDIGEETFTSPTFQAVMNATGYMGTHGTPKMPMHFYKSVKDEISPVADTDALVTKLCSNGAQIEYIRNESGNHTLEAITGAGDAFTFLKDRFDGIPAGSSCSTQTVATDLDLSSLEVLGSTVVEALLAILKVPVGPI